MLMQPNRKLSALTLLLALGIAFSAQAKIKVGEKFPTLAEQKLEGTLPDSLKDKVVMVDFWASWCGPCAESFPAMDELQKKYGPQGLVIIAVNVDEKKADMEAFLKKRKISFTVVRDATQKLVEQTGIPTMPSSFLMDADGKVMFVHTGFRGSETKKKYEQEIESLLKKNAK
jgi:thiol-disulfide isomerase/thioredoxin